MTRPVRVMHLQAGGCGGCALELALVSLPALGLIPTPYPRHAELLLVSGAPGQAMMQAVAATWAAMPEPRYLVALGDCAIGGGAFAARYAVRGGLAPRLPVTLAIPGSPPAPEAIRAALAPLVRAIAEKDENGPSATLSPAGAAEPAAAPEPAPAPVLPALLPAAPRHRLSGDGSSGS